MGLPVIATRHNGFPEGLLEGVSGLLVPEGDAIQLGDAMIELARQSGRWAAMGRAGAAFVRQKFDQATLTAALLDGLAGHGPTLSPAHAPRLVEGSRRDRPQGAVTGRRGCDRVRSRGTGAELPASAEVLRPGAWTSDGTARAAAPSAPPRQSGE